MGSKEKREYRYVGVVETRAGNGTWKYNGEIHDHDPIGTTLAASSYKATRNILYKYVTQVLGLNPDNMWRFRLAKQPKKVEHVEFVPTTELSNSESYSHKEFVQMSIFEEYLN